MAAVKGKVEAELMGAGKHLSPAQELCTAGGGATSVVATSASSLLGVWGGDQDQHHYGHYGHEYTGRMIRTSTIRGRGGVVFSHRPAPYYVPEDLIRRGAPPRRTGNFLAAKKQL